ncbi:T9SS type A sorting domain-containing protein [Candidatus Fermentibacteria bacterium]|nr:T9SS type A sorting domain-containing protein [Candidatus Fermentibacteria bacterium]
MGLIAALSLLAAGLSPPSVDRPLPRLPSVHQIESHAHRDSPPALYDVYGSDEGRSLRCTVMGFLPYWIGSATIRYDLLSILACFSIDMGGDGSITSWHGFPDIFEEPIDSVQASGGVAVVTVTNFSESEIHQILNTYKTQAVDNLVDVVKTTSVEGVCVDFENVDGSDKQNLVDFMELLRSELDTHAPGSHLSICTPAVDWADAFDYSQLSSHVDAMFMMCYAFHGPWSSYAGPCCPLVGWGGPESSSNMVWCLNDYVIWAPLIHDKLLIGLPYYGHQWETEGPSPHSQVVGSCSTLYYETLAERAETYGGLWDQESLTPYYTYYYATWNQGWYDDDRSLGLKYDLVTSADIQGTGMWALGYDGTRPELWDCIEEHLTGEPPSDSLTDNVEATFTLHGPQNYWHNVTTDGQLYGLFYTYSVQSGPNVNWAAWRFDLPDSSSEYSLDVYIPDYGGTADAVYVINHDLGCDSVTIPQYENPGRWVSLGGPYRGTEELEVVLGDNTGTNGQKILFDAIRFEEQTGTSSRSARADRSVTMVVMASPSPSPRVVIDSPAVAGELKVFDLSGRVVLDRRIRAGARMKVELTHLPAGVYMAVLEREGGLLTEKLVVLP